VQRFKKEPPFGGFYYLKYENKFFKIKKASLMEAFYLNLETY
jgi:hypothetical protein